jgi:hypothetical protein
MFVAACPAECFAEEDVTLDFTVACPGDRDREDAVAAIRARGNLPLRVGDGLIAELPRADLLESWRSAKALRPKALDRLTHEAGMALAEALSHDPDTEDMGSIAAAASAFFVLSLRHQGISDVRRLPPCEIHWDGRSTRETLRLRP